MVELLWWDGGRIAMVIELPWWDSGRIAMVGWW